jgi:hypothetical protein
MNTIKQRLAAHIENHHLEDVFSIEVVLRESGEDNRRKACGIFHQWIKYGAIVIVGQYKRESGGAPHKLFKVKDIDILVPKITARERHLITFKEKKAAEKKKAIDDAIVGNMIQSYSLGANFSLAHMPTMARRYIGDMNV